jgi:mitogen-activated protein kinase kinase
MNNTNKATSPPLLRYLDPSGRLNFEGKAIMDSHGVDFTNGRSYRIALPDLLVQEEIGRGQYGVVSRVCHQPTNVTMAMKQIRLDIAESTFRQIQMELEVLHRIQSEYVVEFYGAFYAESCVYICMEFMDAGSLDKLYDSGLEEGVLAKVTESVVTGLSALKEDLHVIHRDVKPTNILVNLRGQVKLCDFGVSGQLVQSLAKTFIGCQSYMAPERIFPMAPKDATYSSQSDVWSLGMTLHECATGSYPFPPQIYDSVFAQLSAIVNEPPPHLPSDRFSPECTDFIDQCLRRDPHARLTYTQMLDHPFLVGWRSKSVDMCGWATEAFRKSRLRQQQSQSQQMSQLQT